MAELSDIQHDTIREQVEEYVEREDERQEMIDLYVGTSPPMQEIAAGVIQGFHEQVDQLTLDALEGGTEAT